MFVLLSSMIAAAEPTVVVEPNPTETVCCWSTGACVTADWEACSVYLKAEPLADRALPAPELELANHSRQSQGPDFLDLRGARWVFVHRCDGVTPSAHPQGATEYRCVIEYLEHEHTRDAVTQVQWLVMHDRFFARGTESPVGGELFRVLQHDAPSWGETATSYVIGSQSFETWSRR
jgi:hypothetical protein